MVLSANLLTHKGRTPNVRTVFYALIVPIDGPHPCAQYTGVAFRPE
jgi:hypothetical protein